MTYPDMKDSGIPWIGKIPSHWKLVRAKYYFEQTNNRGNKTPELLAASQKYGVCPQSWLEGVVKVAEMTDLSQFKTVHANDFVISLRSFQGGFEHSAFEGVCSPAYQVFHAKSSYSNDFLRYLFKSEMFIDEMNSLTVGIREGKTIKFEDFANSTVFIPPLQEQERIAEYLDRLCSQIDAIIDEAKASVEEYKLWKASIVYHAVTKGLDPDAPMKDSGVVWIGQMPLHWKRTKISRGFLSIGSGSTPVSSEPAYYDGEIPWLQSGDIGESEVFTTSKSVCRIALEDISALKIYKAPFIAIAMYGASIANTSIVCIDACTNQACCVLSKPKADIYFKFVYYAVLASKEELLLSARGGTQPNISQDIIKQLKIPIPPLEEQKQIASFLEWKVSEINSIISEKQSLIAELESYKKSLIYEAVTGKRKVG